MSKIKITEVQAMGEAGEAISFVSGGGKKKGGYKFYRSMNAYGIALKYMLAIRDLTYIDAAKMLNVSPQNINYIINRMGADKFNTVYVGKLCRVFNIDKLYFLDLVKNIEMLLEGK